jgi:hypothetical protein
MRRLATRQYILGVGALLLAVSTITACGDDGETGLPGPAEATPTPAVSDLVHYTEEREACDHRNKNGNLYWADIHSHTVLSYDANIWRTRLTPAEAYAFARGEEVILPASGSGQDGTRHVGLSRPLDFAAVTDHQEYLAETYLCTHEDSGAYDAPMCRKFRAGGAAGLLPFAGNLRKWPASHIEEICQSPGVDCQAVTGAVWRSIRQDAEDAYDRSSNCSFTTFPAYEFTLSPNLSNKHRNVIFRNARVPDLPPSSFEESTEQGLWAGLEATCLHAGCDFMSIPHNANWSNGHEFMLQYPEDMTLEQQRQAAAFRARVEPLVEIHQHKGNGECKNGFDGVPDDPLCNFEQIREADFTDCGDTPGQMGMAGMGCLSRYDYVRNVLKLGLSEWLRLGVNPYKLGIVGGTDDHNGLPGKTEEYDYPGHMGVDDDTPEERLGAVLTLQKHIVYNPGGLTAVWAVENGRDALFEALRRRETYSTSGPRITVRFFGGWDFSAGLSDDLNFVSIGYERGVPMGGDLPPRPDGTSAPTFAVKGEKDPGIEGHPGTDLQQVQVIKGWIDHEGNEREKVFVVAGDPDNGAGVDPDTCQPIGQGSEALSAVWADLEFDPGLPAFYYVRVVENPSCSWRQYDCNRLVADGWPRPEGCSDPNVQQIIQERAITSPIWYTPGE